MEVNDEVRISVIVPVRNRRDLLEVMSDAPDKQTRRDLEVLVVDDGYQDGADQVAARRMIANRPGRLLRSNGVR